MINDSLTTICLPWSTDRYASFCHGFLTDNKVSLVSKTDLYIDKFHSVDASNSNSRGQTSIPYHVLCQLDSSLMSVCGIIKFSCRWSCRYASFI
jgi:hypothetical protein